MTQYSVIDIKCPGCGGTVSTTQTNCKFCGNPVVITSFNRVYEMNPQITNKYVRSYKDALNDNPNDSQLNSSLGMCYLKLKLYDKALECFRKATEDDFDNSETYFYAAICLLKGKKAFLTPKVNIEKSQEYINAALMIENRGIYYYFLAYLKYDFYERKSLNIYPDYNEELSMSYKNNVTNADIQILFEQLNVSKPNVF